MARRIVVIEDNEMEALLNGEEIDISFEQPFTKISLVSEKGYNILIDDFDSGRTLKEVKNVQNNNG